MSDDCDSRDSYGCMQCYPRLCHCPIPVNQVHNHGPSEGPGLACRERRVDGRLVGDCLLPPNEGPRTYQCLWRWHDSGAAVLQTAEEWLSEEADIDDALASTDTIPDEISRGGILRAIAKEIAAIRRERTHWAEAYTALVARNQRNGAA